MSDRRDAFAIAQELVPIFEAMGIEYMVMGGLAVVTWGVPRATLDVDFSLASPTDELERFLGRMESEGHVVEEHFK